MTSVTGCPPGAAGTSAPTSSVGMAGFLRLDQMGATLAGVRVERMTLWGLAVAYFLLAWLVTARRSGARAE